MTAKKPVKHKTALVLEGGGMRGIFSAGILDVFMEHSFDPFDMYIGVSAGACNLASHLAGQHRRNFLIYTRLMTSPAFISKKKYITGGHLMDLDYLWDIIDKEHPLDVSAIFKNRKKEFLVVGTSADTGAPVYMRPTVDNCLLCLKASSAVPLLYRTMLEINSIQLVDGGVADPIPALEAYSRGARKIVVIRTRPAEYRKKQGLENYLSSLAVRKWKNLSAAVFTQADTYSRCVDFILNPPEDADIMQIAPQEPLKTGRTTQKMESLLYDYERGRAMGAAFMDTFI